VKEVYLFLSYLRYGVIFDNVMCDVMFIFRTIWKCVTFSIDFSEAN